MKPELILKREGDLWWERDMGYGSDVAGIGEYSFDELIRELWPDPKSDIPGKYRVTIERIE